MIRTLYAAWLLAVLVTFQAQACTPKKQVETNAPATDTPVATNELSGVDKLLQEYVNNRWIAGGVALVIKDGKVLYHKGVGFDDIDKKTPMRTDAIFRIASQTKAITSTGIMMLVEEGKIGLDDPVAKYIPEFRAPQVITRFNEQDTTYTTTPARREITIRHLLTHTAGIGYAQIGDREMNAFYYKAGIIAGLTAEKMYLKDQIKKLAGLPLFTQPGERWTYGLSTDVLGYVIEVASGMSLDAFFRTRIFEPLGMKDTYFYLPASKHSRLVPLYIEQSGKVVKAPEYITFNGMVKSDYPKAAGTYYSGGGGLVSTAQDYGQFMLMLLNGGQLNGKRIIKEETVRQMTTNQIGSLSLRNGNKFGLGFEIVSEANSGRTPMSVGTFLWGGAFSSTYWIDPKEKIVAQLFLNIFHTSHDEIHDHFKTAVYQGIPR